MGLLRFQEGQEGSVWLAPPPADVFVETGTSEGRTLANASQVFKECHSIEMNQDVYLAAIKRFRRVPNVRIYHGSSPDVLSCILDPTKSTFFWLDAHYDPGSIEIPDKYGQCPLLEELKAIMSVEWQAPVYIMIDDAHVFFDDFWNRPAVDHTNPDGTVVPDVVRMGNIGLRRTNLRREEWPTFEQIQKLLPNHELVQIEDVLRGTPK